MTSSFLLGGCGVGGEFLSSFYLTCLPTYLPTFLR